MRSLSLATGLMACFTLSGGRCVPDAPYPNVGPPARCMATVKPIPRPEVGKESKDYSGELIAHSAAEDSKARCLQKFARTVVAK